MDLARFWAAVDAFPLSDLRIATDAEAEQRLCACIAAGGPVLLGEIHGTVENPLLVRALLRQLSLRVLALEWDASLQPALDRYLAGGRVDAWPLPFIISCDGRITAGHLALLRALHDEGALDRLVLFNAWGPSWSDRDRAMADRLLDNLTGAAPALVVAGNMHTQLEPHRYGVPMGHHVARAMPGTASVRIAYLTGETFNIGRRPVGVGSAHARPAGEPILSVEWDALVLTLPACHAAVVPNPDGDGVCRWSRE